MSNEKNLLYAVVCGGVNIDIGAHSFAPLRDRDSNPGRRGRRFARKPGRREL